MSHDGDKLTVVGEEIDSVGLTTLLRKKMRYRYVELVTVTVEEKKMEKEEKEAATNPYYYGHPVTAIIPPPYYYRDVGYDQNSCSII